MILVRYKQMIAFVSGLIVVVLGLTASLYWPGYNRPNVEVIFLDIGQGDSILVKTKYHQNILIDGGPDAKVLDRLGRNLSFWDRRLDMVIATHPDADHIAGLVNVAERYQVDLFLQDGVAHDTAVYKTLLETVARKNIPTRFVESRQIYELADNLFLDVLYPTSSFVGQNIEDNNAASIVVKLTDGQIDYLFTGDAPFKVEEALTADYGSYLESEVLKAGHHGSKTSSGESFLRVVSPEVAVISVGRNNRYGHPSPSVIRRFEQLDIPILRTDQLGDISLASNGQYVELK